MPAGPRPGVVALAFLAVAAAFFLIGIAIASAMREGPEGTVVASERVGPAGATIRFEAGELRVPSGAVAAPTQIVIRRSTVAEQIRVRPPGRPVLVFESRELVAYTFEPLDVTFRRPVVIMFRPAKPTSNAAVFARLEDTTLLLSDQVDPDRGTVTIEVRDFRFDRGQPAGVGP